MDSLTEIWNGLKVPGQDTLGWDEMRKMQFHYAPMHDQIAGGHWIWDDVTAKAQYDFGVALFGCDGRYTKTQWFATFVPYLCYVKPVVEPNVLLPAQVEEWIKLSQTASNARTWSVKSATPEQVKEASMKLKAMREKVMSTPEGRKEMMDSLAKAFKEICPPGDMSAGWEDMRKMEKNFAPMHDKMAGGHWVWDDVTAKASFDFQVKKFGTGGRMTMTQWFSSLEIFFAEVNPFVNPKELTKEQIKEWIKVTKASYEARKWSDSKCTAVEVREGNTKI